MKKKIFTFAVVSTMMVSGLCLSGCDGQKAASSGSVVTLEVDDAETETDFMIDMDDVSELLNKAEELRSYMENNDKIPKDRLDEFNNIVARLNELLNSGTATADEINELKGNLAAMASQAGASNELIDFFTTNLDLSGDDNEDAADDSDEEPSSGVAKFIDDYTDLSNELADKVDKGQVDIEIYMDLVSKLEDVEHMKEELKNNGETEELVKKTDELKPVIYEIADKANSKLKDNFK